MDLTEFYYERGNMPDRYYNQLNKKTPQQNYISFKKKKSNFFLDVLKSSLRVVVMKALDDILKEFKQYS